MALRCYATKLIGVLNATCRLQQLHAVLSEVESWPGHVLLGDFNALRVADYSQAEWETLCSFAAKSGWEERREACYQLMMQHKYRRAPQPTF